MAKTAKLVLALMLAACKSKAADAPKERPQAQVAIPYVPPDATFYMAPGTTITPPPPAQNTELTAALDALRSNDERAIPQAKFWKAHAGEVRPVLTAWLADGEDDGIGDHRALRILGELGEAGDLEVLSHVLKTWQSEIARAEAAAALGVHAEPGASQVLLDASKLDDIAIASHAVTGLGSRKHEPEVRARLEELREHPNATMRARAVAALRERAGGRASPAR